MIKTLDAMPHKTVLSGLCRRRASAPKVLTFAALLLLPMLACQAAKAQTYSVVHSFAGTPSDGSDPTAGLSFDAQGNLYGTTYTGGTAGFGTVFKIDTTGKEAVLHSFAGLGGGDGANPYAGLTLDAQANLYGTTANGGDGACRKGGCGIVFKVDTAGNETVMYSFRLAGLDGAFPRADLLLDAQGNLYGTTFRGGAHGTGTVFTVDTIGNETALFSFNEFSGVGDSPHAGLVWDAQGSLYGTTELGGCRCQSGAGTIFKVDTAGNEAVLYRFGGSPDGANPLARLVLDAQGNLYGTTWRGGADGDGTVFKLDTSGNEAVLYNFTGKSGLAPYGDLVLDAAGNLYGTTTRGGAHSLGTVFKVDAFGNETVLHSFTGKNGDGAVPYAGLVIDAQDNLYGTTSRGGADGLGTVFKLTP
jgi:uncharacterized repeat protein (TIGR03803 family)